MSKAAIPKGLLGELVEQVRVDTSLSYDLSKLAVKTVLKGVGMAVPEVADVMAAILSSMTPDLVSQWVTLSLLVKALELIEDDFILPY